MEQPGREALIATKLGLHARRRRSVVRDRLCAELDTADVPDAHDRRALLGRAHDGLRVTPVAMPPLSCDQAEVSWMSQNWPSADASRVTARKSFGRHDPP